MWPFRFRSRRAAFGSAWWYNPTTNQAIPVPSNSDHYKFMRKNISLFLEPGETPEQNQVLQRWVQIRNYDIGDLVIHFPDPVTRFFFNQTQDWLIGKVEPKRVSVGTHHNTGGVVQKSYADWINADSLSQFLQSRRGTGAMARRTVRLAKKLVNEREIQEKNPS